MAPRHTHEKRSTVMVTALFLAAIVLASCQSIPNADTPPATAAAPAANLPQIILKLDDYGFSARTHPGWAQTMDYLNGQGVVASIGLVGRGLERPSRTSITWMQTQAALGHELWNHGYCHCRPEGVELPNGLRAAEFRGTDLDYQLDQLQRTQDLAKDKLGITLTAFGAPYNSTDATTLEALSQIPAITTWIYHNGPAPDGVTTLPRISAVNIEYPVHQPNFARFKQGFEQHLDADVLVIQGHPRSWVQDPERFAEFQKIIAYLQDQGATFTTPTAYVEAL